MPRRRIGSWQIARLWLLGVVLGGGLLAWNTITEHRGHNQSWIEEDRELLHRYADQLLEVHVAFVRHAEAGNPIRFLTGYFTAEEIADELRMAYGAAAKAQWLDENGQADYALARHYLGSDEEVELSVDLSNSTEIYPVVVQKLTEEKVLDAHERDWIREFGEDADSGWFGQFLLQQSGLEPINEAGSQLPMWYQRHLWVGTSYYGIWLFTLLFAPAAILGLFRGPTPRAWRITATWLPALGLALTFWAMLAANGLAAVAASVVDICIPQVWEGPSYHLSSNVFYLLIQAGPVILISWFLLPTGRSFRRVLGLGLSHLFNAKNLAIVLGFYGIYGFLSFGFYEFEKWVGTIDTRDFLDPGLIDSGQLGLISQIVLAAIIAPVFEELLFRGFLFTSLRSRFNVWIAALVSSLIFAGMHFYSWPALISIAVFGMAMCWLYQRTRSLWPGILFHAFMNLHITLSSWFLYSEDFSWLGYLGS